MHQSSPLQSPEHGNRFNSLEVSRPTVALAMGILASSMAAPAAEADVTPERNSTIEASIEGVDRHIAARGYSETEEGTELHPAKLTYDARTGVLRALTRSEDEHKTVEQKLSYSNKSHTLRYTTRVTSHEGPIQIWRTPEVSWQFQSMDGWKDFLRPSHSASSYNPGASEEVLSETTSRKLEKTELDRLQRHNKLRVWGHGGYGSMLLTLSKTTRHNR